MKRLTAFFTALVLFLITVTGIHLYVNGGKVSNTHTFATWADETKTRSRETVKNNMTKDTLLVFGSSEFMHGQDTPYHPASMFSDTSFSPMLIGAGYYQSLSHSIALAALGDGQKKAVLFLSPQWFRKSGVLPQAFASRFSENDYIGMLKNENLSPKTREYLMKRTHSLLQSDPETEKRLSLYEQVWETKDADTVQTLEAKAWESFLAEKEKVSVPLLFSLTRKPSSSTQKNTSAKAGSTAIDWNKWLARAEEDGAKYQNNPFYMDNKSYRKLESRLSRKKDKDKKAVHGYASSPEYDDLRCFLETCQDMDITPMLVILPVNGYYYDYTGFPRQARDNYYKTIRTMASDYKTQVADFSGDEYTKYFFEDQVHIGRKGWVLINESLYNFYQSA